MLKLYLLRHAQAAGSFDVDDYQRPLTLHGIEQAQAVATSLPDIHLCLCSSALRTKMTLDSLKKAEANIAKTTFSDELYNAPTGALLNAIQQAGDVQNLLLIAHNPGIHQLANTLTMEDNSEIRNKLIYQYAPASLSVLECPIENWKDIQPQQNKLVELITQA